MSDIPVGSPPVPPGRHAAPSGWYPDPVDRTQERYWDGWQWSRNTRVNERPTPGAYAASPGQQPHSNRPSPYGQTQDPYAGGPHHQPGNPPPRSGPGYRGPTPDLTTADGVPLASWWWRALAALLDSMFIAIIAVLPSIPVYVGLLPAFRDFVNRSMEAARTGGTPPAASSAITANGVLVLTMISIGVALIYHTLFLALKSATPGKMICGLRVVPVDQGHHRERLPIATVVVRVLIWVVPTASNWLLVIRLADIILPLWQPKRQALHDLAAKTQVVRRLR